MRQSPRSASRRLRYRSAGRVHEQHATIDAVTFKVQSRADIMGRDARYVTAIIELRAHVIREPHGLPRPHSTLKQIERGFGLSAQNLAPSSRAASGASAKTKAAALWVVVGKR